MQARNTASGPQQLESCAINDCGTTEQSTWSLRRLTSAIEVGPNERRRRLIFIPIVLIRVECIQVVCLSIRRAESAEESKFLES
jgi:hypothetical protein